MKYEKSIYLVLICIMVCFGCNISQAVNLQNSHSKSILLKQKTFNDTKEQSKKAETTIIVELIGKGYYSLSVDIGLNQTIRTSMGLISSDFTVIDERDNDDETYNYMCPNFMYYHLFGIGSSFLELGAGTSIPLNHDWECYKRPMVVHGVIGYRWQIKNGFLLRGRITPFSQPPNNFWPLLGLSIGYSF